MTGWLDRSATSLLDATLAAVAISGLVILAMLQCRQPARRLWWGRAGLLATLGLLPLATLNPVERLDLRGPIAWMISNTRDDATSWLDDRPQPDLLKTIAEAGDYCEPSESASPSVSRRLGHAMVVVYLAGLTIGLLWVCLGLWGVVRLIGEGTSPSEGSLKLFEALPQPRGSKPPRLLVSRRASRPVLVGVFRPVILIPPKLDEVDSADQLRLSLLHELAHFENLDHRFAPLASLAESIWFFLPMFWWIRDQLKIDQEFLADRWAVTHYGTSDRYASSLIDLAAPRELESREGSTAVTIRPSLTMPGAASALVQRVQMLLKCPFPIEGESPIWWRWSTTLTLLVATLATSCLTLRGLEGWWEPITSPVTESSHAFRLPQLEIAPGERQAGPFEIRYRLPEAFTLTLEILAETSELTSLEILGYPMGLFVEEKESPKANPLWHRVLIRRAAGHESVEVDGKIIPCEPPRTSRSPWLTIRSLLSRPTRIRDLSIEW